MHKQVSNDSAHGLNYERGFIALIAVIILATGTLAFSLATLTAAAAYSESVTLKELRIQARFNLAACMDTLGLMFDKDYFLNGEVSLQEFSCQAGVMNDLNGSVILDATSTLGSVSLHERINKYLPPL